MATASSPLTLPGSPRRRTRLGEMARRADNGSVAGILNTSWLFQSPASSVAHSPHVDPTLFGQTAHQSITSALSKLDALCDVDSSSKAQAHEVLTQYLSLDSDDQDLSLLQSKELFHMLAGERRDRVMAPKLTTSATASTFPTQTASEEDGEGEVEGKGMEEGEDADTEEDESTPTTILGRQKREVDRLLKETKWQSLRSGDLRSVPPACHPQISSIAPPVSTLATCRTKAPPSAASPTCSSPTFPSSPPPVLITLSIHHPQHPNARTHQLTLCAARHTLADVRDHVFCPTDYMSDADKQLNDPRPGGRKTSPSVFVIEGALYIDGRAGYRALDAAMPIIRHYQAGGLDQADIQRYRMDETLLADVGRSEPAGEGEGHAGWRINVPYAFVHQNGCEHMLVVQDIRLANPATDNLAQLTADPPKPVTTFRAVHHLPPCAYCHHPTSHFITYGDACAMQSPCYWCTQCYHDVHYNKRTGDLVYSDYSVHEIVREQVDDHAGL